MPATPLRNLNDDELLASAQNKDEAAFEELMRRNSLSSFKLALSILKDRQDAEDEVQNSYWKAWWHFDQFQRDSKFSTWISRIVINQCLMRLRKARKASFLYLDEGAGESGAAIEIADSRPAPEAEFAGNQAAAVLHREISRMPALLRNALILRDLHELSMDEVAARLGVSGAAAKSRLLRARVELRARLEKHLLLPHHAK